MLIETQANQGNLFNIVSIRFKNNVQDPSKCFLLTEKKKTPESQISFL